MRILFPTDFSDAADHAFVYALQLAKATGASILTFHAYQLPDIRGVRLPNTLRNVYESISLEEFENYKDSIPVLRAIAAKEGAMNVDLSHVLQQGEPIASILNAIPANNIDMVILGTTGAGRIKELFMGSVAAEVMENARVPVLAIPYGAKFDGHIDKIAVATELLEEDERVLPKVLEFARLFGAEVMCVNADVAHTTRSSQRLEDFRKKFPGVDVQILDSLDVENSVSAFVKNQHIDILAMLIHKRSRLNEMFNYSLTKRFAHHLKIPIWTIQAHSL